MAHIPLFQKNLILRTIGDASPLPDSHLKTLRKWQASLQSGALNKVKEISLHGQFVTDLFWQKSSAKFDSPFKLSWSQFWQWANQHLQSVSKRLLKSLPVEPMPIKIIWG